MRMARIVMGLVLALMFGTALAACDSGEVRPDGEPILRGVIVSVAPGDGGGGGRVRVVWHESAGERTELDSCDVTVGAETDLIGEDGSVIEFADLAERAIVEVWISGPIAESYPPQATADAIKVVGQFDPVMPLPIPPGLVEPGPAE